MEAAADELEAGRRALELAHWAQARESFEAVLAAEESAEAREGLGLALWFLGDVAAAIDSRSRAFELYAAAGRCDADAGAHRFFGGTDERELVSCGIERRPAAGERQLVALMPAERLDPGLAFERDALVEYHPGAIR